MVRKMLGIVAVVASLSFVGLARGQQDPPQDPPQDQPKGGMHDRQAQPKRNMHAGYFGVKMGPVTEDAAKDQKLDTQDGVLVMELIPGSPAEKAGIKVDDIIRKVDGQDVDSVEDFVGVMEKTKPDQVCKFTVTRDGKEQEVSVTLGVRPPNMGMPAPKEPKHDSPPSTPPSTQGSDGSGK